MTFQLAHDHLDWPLPELLLQPRGGGPVVYAAKMRAKVEAPLKKRFPGASLHLGVLHRDPAGESSDAPLAIVCQFDQKPAQECLRELHRLAWNFCHALLLITFEPGLIRVWDCARFPAIKPEALELDLPEQGPVLFQSTIQQKKHGELFLDVETLRLLHWVNLAGGAFFREKLPQTVYRANERADRSLLENLRAVRARLREALLPVDLCHDLLARVIFIQFLFDRKDASGNSALNPQVLARWHREGLLSNAHKDFASVLRSKHDTYELFHKLDTLFNGDLFPGKDETDPGSSWVSEKRTVRKEHLELLARLVAGEDDARTGQFWLWKQYSFDTIPLEFISSIYEEFVTRDDDASKKESGVVFTPGMLADYVLDQVLPWSGIEWNLSVLDPSCGSGIFLVKTFQRLVHRWRTANADDSLQPSKLRRLLEKNLFGVDINPHAIRVASFSLYLAMLDELDPRDYLERVRFPSLRHHRLVCSDFFAHDWNSEQHQFDLIVGNAPWGHATLTEAATAWAKDNNWIVANNDPGTLFLPACEKLLKTDGRLSMLQPAMSLLFNRSGTAKKFRRKFFSAYLVDKIVNFSPVRFILFGGQSKAISPACLVVMRAGQHQEQESPNHSGLEYSTVKPSLTAEDECRLTIDSFDIHWLPRNEAATDLLVWTCLSWGGRRDIALLRAFGEHSNLESSQNAGHVLAAKGLKWIEAKAKPHEWLKDRHIADKEQTFSTSIELQAEELPQNQRILAERPRTPKLFGTPQILLPQTWKSEQARFRAIKIHPDKMGQGALCTQSYISAVGLTTEGADVIHSAWIVFNSKIAVYHQLLTSGRFASYRPEALVEDLKLVPLPHFENSNESQIKTPADCDKAVRRALKLAPEEWVLVEDLFDYTLPDFKQPGRSPGRKATARDNESTLRAYAEYFTKVMVATFGHDKQVSCAVWQEADTARLGFRLVRFTLIENGGEGGFQIFKDDLGVVLDQVAAHFRDAKKQFDRPIVVEPVMRFYGSIPHEDDSRAPAIWIVKPDQIRYWTRSMAMRDADEVAADIMLGGNQESIP